MEAKDLIKEIIEKQGVTRYRIAKDLKVNPSNVYDWESGRTRPNGSHLLELLRRAGRLAAMVMLGVVGVASAPQDADASNGISAKNPTGIYTLYA